MLLAETSVVFDPTWPWSLPGIGLPLLAGVALLLIGLTVWTYLGARGSNFRRILCVLLLRLGALLVACFLVLRPCLAEQDDENALPSKLLVLVDKSESMNFTDESFDLSRWGYACRILDHAGAALKRLAAEQRVEVVYYQGAEDVSKFEPQGKADGKRTDMGEWLHKLLALHGKETNLRGLVLLTDGADNGTRFPTLEQAASWRSAAPLYVFGLGKETTTAGRSDIAFVPNKIFVDPNPVPVKGKLTVKGFVNASSDFVNQKVNLSLLINDKLAAPVQSVILRKVNENEVKVECDAPLTPGEIKVTLKIDPLDREVSKLNNEISTYATVTKEGVSILWVEGRQRLESAWAMRALLPDKRFRVIYTLRLKQARPGPAQEDWYQFKKHQYDVVVIGDITAGRFAEGDPTVFTNIKNMVDSGRTGLLMLGGRETLAANGDWQQPAARDLIAALPVDLTERGHFEEDVLATPAAGKDHFVTQLSNDPVENTKIWTKHFDKLKGMARLGTPRPPGADTLAVGDLRDGGQAPLLIVAERGEGRSAVFAAEDTYRAWTKKDKKAVAAYQLFWRKLMLWLAHQEKTEGNIRVYPDLRRISADTQSGLGFTVEVIGKGGLPVKDARLKVTIIGPNNETFVVPTGKEDKKERGYFQRAKTPGEYRIVASPADPKDKEKPGEAKFLVYAEDLESLRPAADHDFLRKLAQAGRGKFYLADEKKFTAFLDELRAQKTDAGKPKLLLWPDWRRNPASDSLGDQLETLWNSTALACFLLFSTFLCVEWYLRRRWGMV
jgi:uncharacterized membrane protein